MKRPNRIVKEELQPGVIEAPKHGGVHAQRQKFAKAMSGNDKVTTTCNVFQRQWDMMEEKATRKLTKSDIFREALDLYFEKQGWI